MALKADARIRKDHTENRGAEKFINEKPESTPNIGVRFFFTRVSCHTVSSLFRGMNLYRAACYKPVWSCSPVRAANNHALAIFQSRLTVSGEIPKKSAVSSTLNPPK